MLRWLTKNMGIFLLAFILALAVWMSAITDSDPDETSLYPSNIPIEFVGQDPQLMITGSVADSVQVTLRAPKSVWTKLTADNTSVRAIVDLTGLEAGEHTVNVQVQISIRPVR